MADIACGRCRTATATYVATGNIPQYAHLCRFCYEELSPELQSHYLPATFIKMGDDLERMARALAKGKRYYGPRTKARTMHVQASWGIKVDGIAGYETFRLTKFPKPWPLLPLRNGDYGEAVERWQDHLSIKEFLDES